ncbi:MAG: hypothetical protein IJY65_00490 [Clostridia bacterium]|nr:hypothetical protein [Clostridia bacterium]
MNQNYEKFRAKAFSTMRALAKDSPEFADAEMLVMSSEVDASLKRSTIHKSIDNEWVDKIEATLPYLDVIVRNPSIMIEDVDEVLPVELSRHIGEKSIKHLAQHTNLILDITEDEEVIPQKILNVFHEETLLTYENKFINTLLVRLSAFVDKRYKALKGGYGTERNYKFSYSTEFEHYASESAGRNQARVNLSIELTSPLTSEISEPDIEANEQYTLTLARVERISNALMAYMSSPYVRALGRNYVRPPVIRTNAILKNKNMKECLNLWEYIESFDKVGFSFVTDEYSEMPSDQYISDLYSSVALQYTNFYNGVAESPEDNRLLSKRHLQEVYPEFDSNFDLDEIDDYMVYDSEYKKTVPVSRLMNNRKKLSEDERRVRLAIMVALKADELINKEELEREAEERRLARERRIAEEEERRRAEEEARRLAEEEARRLAEEEERKRAEALAALAPVEVRYRRSFLSRYIQSGDELQGFYSDIKNELLSYKGVKSRISWKCETYKKQKTILSRIDVKGKAIYLYLNLDPAEFENSKYFITDASGKAGGEDTPLLLKVKSERGRNHALELIGIMMEKMGLVRIEREAEDYRMPYEDNDALIERGLIKLILPQGVTLEDGMPTVNTDVGAMLASVAPTSDESAEVTDVAEAVEPAEDVAEAAAEPTSEEAEAATEAAQEGEEPALEVADAAEATVAESEASAEGVPYEASPVEVRYRRSFLSRYIQSGDELQGFYCDIKNDLLSYKGVKSRISWKCETYKKQKNILSRIDVKGKAIYLYLNLEPADFEDSKYFITDASGKAGGEDTPLLLKVKSERGRNHALELIGIMMARFGIERFDREPADYRMPYEDNDALIEEGLIKLILPQGVTLEDGMSTVNTDVGAMLASVAPTSTDAAAEEVAVEEAAVEEATEITEAVEEPAVEAVEEPAEPVVEEVAEAAVEEAAVEEAAVEAIEAVEADEVAEAVEADEAEPVEAACVAEPEEPEADEIVEIVEAASRVDLTDDMVIMALFNIAAIRRKSFTSVAKDEFSFSDSVAADGAVCVPYTREAYLALPRKKKKSVLMNVKRMLSYRKTRMLLDLLVSMNSKNPRIAERIERLEERLSEEEKFLPTAPLWETCIQRLKK